jgi:hypothetical protein
MSMPSSSSSSSSSTWAVIPQRRLGQAAGVAVARFTEIASGNSSCYCSNSAMQAAGLMCIQSCVFSSSQVYCAAVGDAVHQLSAVRSHH